MLILAGISILSLTGSFEVEEGIEWEQFLKLNNPDYYNIYDENMNIESL